MDKTTQVPILLKVSSCALYMLLLFMQKTLKSLSSNLLWFSYPDMVPFIFSLGILEKPAVLYYFLQNKTKPASSLSINVL